MDWAARVSANEKKDRFVQFVDIKDPLVRKELKVPNLNVLAADADSYEVLAIQPTGDIELRNDFIGHVDRDSAKKKFSAYLELALQKDCDLVLAPEYSCPWEVLKTAIQDNKLPTLGKLWILGCESITPHDLAEMTSLSNVVWIHEPIPTTSCQFLGVLAYVLKTESNSGEIKDVVVLQFKTQPMADPTGFERDHLIKGRITYFLHNQNDYIRLVSLICSETLVFQPSNSGDCRFELYPFIIFHPQLGSEPRHPDIKNYRGRLFSRNNSDHIEVLALNWARGFKLGQKPPSEYGGSAVYMKSDQFDLEHRLDANHQKGLYYCRWHAYRTHLCLFNFDEHVFHLKTQKVDSVGPAVLPNRSGPEMLALWKWNAREERWCVCETADDGFKELCDSYGTGSCDFCTATPFTPVDRERLLTLSAGKLDPRPDWHLVKTLDSFVAEEDETSKRLTFVHDPCQHSADFRRDHLGRYIKLQTSVIANAANLPPNIHDLRGDCHLRPPKDENNFRYNLVSKSGSAQGATAVFVGLQAPPYVQELRDKFVAAWGQPYTRRLVIWYEHEDMIKCEHLPLPKITDDSEPPTSIARTDGP